MKATLYVYCLCLFVLLNACSQEKSEDAAFRLLSSNETGLDFENSLQPDKNKNIFSYMYFYNGGGIGAGDLNNDGLIDVCFTSNLGPNKIFINKGNLRFEDVTQKTNFNATKQWSNGVSIVDINQDGKLDIYVTQATGFDFLNGKNLLFVCQTITKEGIPIYKEEAAKYGLDISALGTQAVFFDQDLDGDLDCFLLNHSVHQNGTFGFRSNFRGKFHPLAGDRYFERVGQHYVDKTQKANIVSDVLGYGLGVSVSDINLDGYPDMYIGNDFHENDYLYLNNKKGGFTEELEQSMGHTSQFSMGIDIADINQDAYPEIISLDMLPSDRQILKRSEGEDSYNIFQYKLRQGYNHQFARNNLQLNRGASGKFSEIGLMANVYATDWSWTPLLFDFENDGYNDLFISNGIPKRMNDIDYIQFVSNEKIQQKIAEKKMDENDMSLTDLLPEIKLPNRFFGNKKNLSFSDKTPYVEGNVDSFSNGAIYADFDNDGDLDIITNNINDKAFFYENLSKHSSNENDYLKIELKGPKENINAIGAKIWIESNQEKIVAQKFPVRGFQSSMEIPLQVGLGDKRKIKKIYLIWPDNTYQEINPKQDLTRLKISYRDGLKQFDYKSRLKKVESKFWIDETAGSGLDFTHIENSFNEFDREALIPHMASAEGPALAVGDLNMDGLEDIFLGNARDQQSNIFLQTLDGKFVKMVQTDLIKDIAFEDVDAVIADFNGDKKNDLVVLSGGNEFGGNAPQLQPRLYLNGQTKYTAAFAGIFLNGAKIGKIDFNHDGAIDLIITGRSIPFEYGKSPRSYFLKNDGKGNFTDVTLQVAPEFRSVGMVRNMDIVDIDQDKDLDVVLALEWQSICIFENKGGKFKQKSIDSAKGWWSAVKVLDIDLDGDQDILAGNLGLNARLKPSEKQPVRLYLGDFDANQKYDQVLSYYLEDVEIPFANKMEMEKQFPLIKKQFIYAKDFAKATVKDFLDGKFTNGDVLEANYFTSVVYLNDGKGNFEKKPLPQLAQIAPINTFEIVDLNKDKLPDVILGANFYRCNIQMGRYDADYGTVLINKGKGKFEVDEKYNLSLTGELKSIKTINRKGKNSFIFSRNNEPVIILGF